MELKYLFGCFFLTLAMNCNAQMDWLKQMQWNNRVVLIFSDDASSSFAQAQAAFYTSNLPDYDERDLKVYLIVKNQLTELSTNKTIPVDATQVRKFFTVQIAESCFILIGKDGGEKLRSNELVSNERLFAIIDAMPMRRREMQRRGE